MPEPPWPVTRHTPVDTSWNVFCESARLFLTQSGWQSILTTTEVFSFCLVRIIPILYKPTYSPSQWPFLSPSSFLTGWPTVCWRLSSLKIHKVLSLWLTSCSFPKLLTQECFSCVWASPLCIKACDNHVICLCTVTVYSVHAYCSTTISRCWGCLHWGNKPGPHSSHGWKLETLEQVVNPGSLTLEPSLTPHIKSSVPSVQSQTVLLCHLSLGLHSPPSALAFTPWSSVALPILWFGCGLSVL